MAEEQPRWNAMYRAGVAQTFQGCVQVQAHLAGARTDLASLPLVLDTRDAKGLHTLLNSAVNHVKRASSYLNGFKINAVGVELLVLQGCGEVPSEPVAGIGELRGHHDEWVALRSNRLCRLEGAREHAQDALRGVEAAFVLLDSVRFMLHSRIPDTAGRRQAMEEQLHAAAAAAELQAVVGSVVNMSTLAFFATECAVGYRIQ